MEDKEFVLEKKVCCCKLTQGAFKGHENSEADPTRPRPHVSGYF